MKIATFNLENLFTRPSAMSDVPVAQGQQAIDDHAQLNNIVQKSVYTAADKARLIAIEATYKFAALSPPSNALVFLQKIRGQLYSRSRAGAVSVVANGRADWTGWFDLRRTQVAWEATRNTGRVIEAVDADILICVEVEDRPTLQRFNEQVLGAEFNKAYAHVMVIDGNDSRGIDVGILSRFPITGIRSHVDDENSNGERTFSRDCPEYVIAAPGEKPIVIMPNHFKSKRGGNDIKTQARRRAQGMRAHAIAVNALAMSAYVLVAGDLNDTPDSEAVGEVMKSGFEDVQRHPSYPTDRPGTFNTGTATNKIDYLIMSPALKGKLRNTGIERRGSFHPGSWEPFDTVTSAANEASDHHLVWAEFASLS
jgi:endonuclease/exonuclease/phosphatase family metal-dependent hydrolase